MTSNGRIDVHQHVIPPAYRRLLADRGQDASGWTVPPWDEAAALTMMDARGIAAGVLSVSTPGVHLGDDGEAGDVARQVNEYTADLVARRPDKFGHLASLPLPDADGAVTAARYAFFDTALSASPASLPSVLAFAQPGHVLHGSDWPYIPAEQGAYFDACLDAYDGWRDGEQQAVNHGNAERLFPRLPRAIA